MTLWDSVYSSDSSFFGDETSVLARESLPLLNKFGCKLVLELGCGQGRDAIFFARNGLKVHAVDSSGISVAQLRHNLTKLGLDEKIRVSQADLSKELPAFEAADAVYSHLFLCMPFNDEELKRIFDFAYDLLPERGLHIFSIRNKKNDKSFGKGKEVAKDTFEINGFKVRFFTEEEILSFNRGFKTLRVIEACEEPCSLTLVFSMRQSDSAK